jgi:hypothetical protein
MNTELQTVQQVADVTQIETLPWDSLGLNNEIHKKKTSFRIADVAAKIRIGNLPDKVRIVNA